MTYATSACAAAALFVLLPVGASQAAMVPPAHFATSQFQHVDCAVGFHVGPAGACIIGTDEPRHDEVIERRATDDDCATKSVTRTDNMGNSETRTRTNCD